MNAHVMQAKFKVGDRVRFTEDNPDGGRHYGAKGAIARIVRVRNDVGYSGSDVDIEPIGWQCSIKPSAPSRVLEAYQEYNVGDKVRALVGYDDISKDAIYTVIAVDQGDRYMPVCVRNDDGDKSWLVKDEFEAVQEDTARRPNVAAQVDTIADEYGAGAKPKFSIGDRVECIKNSDDQGFDAYGTVADVGNRFVGVEMDAPFSGHGASMRRWNFYYPDEQLILVNQPSTAPAIVARLDNGQPRPANRPFVHADRGSAEKEAARLARANPGKEFGVYEFVSSAKEERRYEHEWQRLAAGGETVDARKALQRTGLTGIQASRIVQEFVAAV